MPLQRLAFLAAVGIPALLGMPAHAQTSYEGASTEQPAIRKDPDNSAAVARTQRRLGAERAKRRESVRITDPRAAISEPSYRGGRLTSEGGTYSLPAQPSGNRALLVPQR